jgi:hypothetical protein
MNGLFKKPQSTQRAQRKTVEKPLCSSWFWTGLKSETVETLQARLLEARMYLKKRGILLSF